MTEALARISARRPWLTIALWVVVVLVALVLVDRLLGSATTTEPASHREYRVEPRRGLA